MKQENLTNETKSCKYCMAEIPTKAKVCPNCKRALKKNKGCLITVLVFILLVGVIGVAANQTSKTNNNGDPNSSATSGENSDTNKVVAFGIEGNMGDLSLIVNAVTEADSISAANGYMKYTPDSGKYAIVNVTIKNTSKESQQLLLNYFKLIGPDGSEYISSLVPAADEKFLDIDSVNPNLDITGNLVFEIPKDLPASDCILKYSDFNLFSGSFEFGLK